MTDGVAGQSIVTSRDRATLPSAGSGYEWRSFDRTTYVNPNVNSKFYNLGPTDFVNQYIMKDDVLNNPASARTQFDTGPLEAVIHMRTPV